MATYYDPSVEAADRSSRQDLLDLISRRERLSRAEQAKMESQLEQEQADIVAEELAQERDWHSTAAQGAGIGSMFGPGLGTLIGAIAGTGVGQARAMKSRMDEGQNPFQAFFETTTKDALPTERSFGAMVPGAAGAARGMSTAKGKTLEDQLAEAQRSDPYSGARPNLDMVGGDMNLTLQDPSQDPSLAGLNPEAQGPYGPYTRKEISILSE